MALPEAVCRDRRPPVIDGFALSAAYTTSAGSGDALKSGRTAVCGSPPAACARFLLWTKSDFENLFSTPLKLSARYAAGRGFRINRVFVSAVIEVDSVAVLTHAACIAGVLKVLYEFLGRDVRLNVQDTSFPALHFLISSRAEIG